MPADAEITFSTQKPPVQGVNQSLQFKKPKKKKFNFNRLFLSTYFRIVFTFVLMITLFFTALFIAFRSEQKKKQLEEYEITVPDAEIIVPDTDSSQGEGSTSWNEEEQVIADFFEGEEESIPLDLNPNEMWKITDIRIEGEWASAEATLIDKNTSEPLVGEATIFLFRKQNQNWSMATPGTDIYKEWLDEVPTSLIPEDLKVFLR